MQVDIGRANLFDLDLMKRLCKHRWPSSTTQYWHVSLRYAGNVSISQIFNTKQNRSLKHVPIQSCSIVGKAGVAKF